MPKRFQTYWFGDKPLPTISRPTLDMTNKDDKWQTFITALKTSIQLTEKNNERSK